MANIRERDISTFIPLNKKGLNCLEACLLSLASHYYDEYQAVLLQCFNFNFAKESTRNINTDTIGERFDLIPTQILNYIKEFYSIEIIEYDLNNQNDKFDFVCKSLAENEPIILMISAYYCNWLQTYHTVHQQHFILVIGKADQDSFICSDPMFMGSNFSKMSFDDFLNGCQCVYRVARQSSISSPEPDYLISLTQKHLEKLQLEHSFDLFINVLNNTQSIENEYSDSKSTVWSSLLDMHVGYFLTGSHQLYAEYLVFLASLKTCLQPLVEEAERSLQISKKWNNVRNFFYKSHLKNTFDTSKSKIINEIKDLKTMSIDLKSRVLKELDCHGR